jgi:hypothetical protein
MKKKNKYRFVVAFCFFNLCLFSICQAGTQSWEWAKKMYSKSPSAGMAIATDAIGNSYVTGSFSDTLHIDGTVLKSKGSYDIFLAKFDRTGELIWVKQAGGIDMDEAYGIAGDNEGNVYITGYISGKAEFSQHLVNGSSSRDFFLTKYDSEGNVLWINLEAGVNEDYGKSVCVDNNGDVYATGIFHGTIKTEKATLKSKSSKNTFIIKHDRNGNFLWAKTGASSGSSEASEINVDSNGNVFVAGTFQGVAEFDKKVIVSLNHKEVFLVKYSPQGEIQWLKKGGASSDENTLSAVATDSIGNIVITGSFSGTAFFGNKQLKSNGANDLFIVKYDNDGEVVWATQAGGKGDEIARSLEVDKSGNIFIAGEFNFSFSFGKSDIQNIGDWDVFVLKYSREGEMVYGSHVGGTGFNKATGISVDNLSDIYIIGYFSQKASFGNLALEANRKDGSGFIAKYHDLLSR